MNISLTAELDELIAEKVKSGMYHSSSEVVREALRLLKERDELKQLRLRELQTDIEIGKLKDARDGRSKAFDGAAIKSEGRKRLEQRKKKSA